MSQISSIKIKIDEDENLGTLWAEYGGAFQIKVWILHKGNAWTGELSSEEAEDIILRFDLTKDVFLKELQRALTTSDPIVFYSISKVEDRGYVLSWKRCLDSGITAQNGEITIESVSKEELYEELITKTFERNSYLRAEQEILQREKNQLSEEKERLLTRMESFVNEKQDFEKTLYSRCVAAVNEKKLRIRELQEAIEKISISTSSSKGTHIMAE